MSARMIWVTWFVASLLWFAASMTYLSGGADFGSNPMGHYEPTRLSPQLARADCSPMVDPLSRSACEGATAMARQRRVSGDLLQGDGQAIAGTIIIAPPLAALILVVVFARRAERRGVV